MHGNRWSGYWFLAPYLALFAVFLLGPVLFGLALSFMHYDLASTEPARFAGLSNFSEAASDPYFRKALGATVKFVLMSVPLTVPLALLLAVAVDSAPPGRQMLYRVGIFAPTVVTISVVGLIWRWFFVRDVGLFAALLAPLGIHIDFLGDPDNAMYAIVITTLWWTVGGPMLILLAGLKQIPAQYYEAAAIDGATGWRAFWQITLPLLRPALLFTLVMNVIGAFQVFGQPFIMTAGGPLLATRVAMQYIYETAFRNYRLGYGAAMSWLLFAVIAVFAVIQFRLAREERIRPKGATK
jgi:multiple sugar transport system permease protein